MNKRLRFLVWSGGGILCFLFTFMITISLGSAELSVGDVWDVIFYQMTGLYLDHKPEPFVINIIWFVRLPRVLLAGVVGAILAMSGVIFQGILRNSLADPFVLGVSSGAAAGAALSLFFGFENLWLSIWATPLAAMCGACVAIGAVLFLARNGYTWGQERLILAGMIIQAFFAALLSLIVSLSTSEIQRIIYWMMGSLSMRDWNQLLYVSIALMVGFCIAFLWSRELNLLALGDQAAAQLGVRVHFTRILLILCASMMTAVAVSVVGTIGFVGLIIPHILRFLCGGDHRFLLPLAALYGAVFLMWSDCFARTLFSPKELPIGVITAFIGVPFFAYLLKKQRKAAFTGRGIT
ncbi:iron complex transport system permease protein [Seinonella peptonophila]|uniref:Iron complex transport system permease protein n=1 Tax=Seinonella peptonophila TaxID=112248 RepID=A0A1M5AIM6_9BACL|nr:iron ABC transporter permease [Seinonella peptonophila]SHF29995.1 iron complex transport system permease protein [Seinonella peptonophila]